MPQNNPDKFTIWWPQHINLEDNHSRYPYSGTTEATALEVLCDIDAYKLFHKEQYPPGTQIVYSNYTNRGSRILGVTHAVNFGLQAYIKRVLIDQWECFFNSNIDKICYFFEKRCSSLVGENSIRSIHLRKLHQLGYLPLKISQIPEGMLAPVGVPSFTIENTNPEFFWLTNYLETSISSHLWQPITSATTAWHNRRLLNAWAAKTGADIGAVSTQGHDFSARGMTGREAAAASGAAHLLSFLGTDTVSALNFIDHYYPGNNGSNGVIGVSCPATEHSVMCAGGKKHEKDTFSRLLDLYPSGPLAIVSDTWDLWNVITNILPALKDKILSRNGTLLIRPDSGDPQRILCGDPDKPQDSPANLGVARLLWNLFGGHTNEAGYKVLDSHIGIVYGDSITYDRANAICNNLADLGFVSTTVGFGFGSYTYQGVTRDTLKSALKATWVQIDGEGVNIFKDPITDDGTKKSATGRLAVTRNTNGQLELIQHATAEQEHNSLLTPHFLNGKLITTDSFTTIRKRLWQHTHELAESGTLTPILD